MDLFIQRIISLSPKLVIGDTLARCMPGGDENSAKDMGLLVEHTDKVRRRVDCTLCGPITRIVLPAPREDRAPYGARATPY